VATVVTTNLQIAKDKRSFKDKADKRKPEDKKEDTMTKKKVKLAKALQVTIEGRENGDDE
jgi:hypothetical protein